MDTVVNEKEKNQLKESAAFTVYYMYHTLYTFLVLVNYPSTSSDLRALGDDQFQIREAATRRLETYPSWTAEFFKRYAQKSKDPEIRLRCRRVYKTQEERWNRIIVAFIDAWERQKQLIKVQNRIEQQKNVFRKREKMRMENMK